MICRPIGARSLLFICCLIMANFSIQAHAEAAADAELRAAQGRAQQSILAETMRRYLQTPDTSLIFGFSAASRAATVDDLTTAARDEVNPFIDRAQTTTVLKFLANQRFTGRQKALVSIGIDVINKGIDWVEKQNDTIP